MKILIIPLFIILSLSFSQQTHFIGGVTVSTIDGDLAVDTDKIIGYKVGIEYTKLSSYITGIAYTQRGCIVSNGKELEFNYLTFYVYKPVYTISPELDLLVGGELGLFYNGNLEGDYIKQYDWADSNGRMLDYGLVLGGRYYINEKMTLVGTYYWALSKVWNNINSANRSFQIYIKLRK